MDRNSDSDKHAAPRRIEMDFFDSAAIAETISDADVEIEQRKPGAFRARISSLPMRSSELVTGFVSQPYGLRGTHPLDVSLFSFWFPGTGSMRVRGIDFDAVDTLVFGQDGAEIEEVDYHGNNRYGTFAMGREAFLELAESVFELDPELINAEILVLPDCGELLESLRRKIREVEALAGRSPGVFSRFEATGHFERMLVDGFMEVLSHRGGTRREGTPASRHRSGLLRKADEFMRLNCEKRFSLHEICQAVGASKRALQYAFQDGYGMSPMTYLRIHRLNRARRDLIEGDPGSTSVTDVALRHGCYHLGRFSSEYGNHFGERPSETLRKGRAANTGR